MTLPLDTSPIDAAIVHALTTYTGQPRCLAADALFRLGRPADVEDPPRGSDLYGRRVCWVMPTVSQETDPQLQLTDRMRVECVIEIRCWYYAGDGIATPEWDDAKRKWTRDRVNVANALTYPSALYYAPDGQRTGLDGGSLRVDAGRHTVSVQALPRRESVVNGIRHVSPLVVQVGHIFRSGAELSRATAT